jgi:dTDP-glucose 4,6-dehydratase
VRRVLVTGGAGFIGSAFVCATLARADGDLAVTTLDALTYAGDTARLASVADDPRHTFVRGDICDSAALDAVFAGGADLVVHFAAESHVDRSIEDALPFERTNVRGTLALLGAARRHGCGRFVHISTDEVYGALGEGGRFAEDSPLRPNSPYAASKAAAEMFVRAYNQTYGVPVVVVRPSNTYGPWQFPEKLVPVAIARAMDGKPVPVYGEGLNVREWMHVEDCVSGILAVADKGAVGEAYNIGGDEERRTVEVARAVLSALGRPETLIEHVPDRPGHDFRYALDTAKAEAELGWRPSIPFERGIEETVKWYAANETWWRDK